jgi:hypothetical protein
VGTFLFHHDIPDISLDLANPMPPILSPPIRHLLVDPLDDEAVCGYRRGPSDTVEGSYIDPGSVECQSGKCVKAANGSLLIRDV